MAKMIELLQALPIFSSLKKKEIKFLAEIAREVDILRIPFSCTKATLGTVYMSSSKAGLKILKSLGTAGEYVIGFRGPGEYIGEMYLFNPKRVRTASVRSLTRVNLLKIATDDFKAL